MLPIVYLREYFMERSKLKNMHQNRLGVMAQKTENKKDWGIIPNPTHTFL